MATMLRTQLLRQMCGVLIAPLHASYRNVQAIQYSNNRKLTSNGEEGVLLFDFKNLVSSLQEATQVLVKAFDNDAIVAIKRQRCDQYDLFRIEVLFASKVARHAALLRGVTYKGMSVKPKPLAPSHRGYLVVDISDLPTERSTAADAHIRQGILPSLARLPNFKLVDVILNRTQGIYNGTARIVLSIKITGSLAATAQDIRFTYRESENQIEFDKLYVCCAFCSRCKKLDDHEADDCTRFPPIQRA
ncbi:hypothetical protein BCR43DRAFT_507815 [Syncephalastrum racemosum]|uniref:Uncharacterized protein n=1 Tax=Syncephalastrum racemosum TaxID=13706 RepID=A0A1X2H644_SYNRA|nr:hypothetical protein BCR43DRAFT_507815 [Syncephalastrum racemosum]